MVKNEIFPLENEINRKKKKMRYEIKLKYLYSEFQHTKNQARNTKYNKNKKKFLF